MGYTNGCTCSGCDDHAEQNELMIYAADTEAPLDRPEAKKLLMRYGSVEKAQGVVDEMIAAAKRKAA